MKKIVSLVLVLLLLAIAVFPGPITAGATQEYYTSLAKEIADEGMVLLENDGTLPLSDGKKVAVFGKGYIDYYASGGGSGALSSGEIVTPTMALKKAVDDGRLGIYEPLDEFYHTTDLSVEPVVPSDIISGAAAYTDTAVLFISRFSEESKDLTAEKGSYYLSDEETALVTEVAAKFEKVVVILNIGSVMDTSWLKGDSAIVDPAGVLVAWLPGIQGASSIVDILTGEVNPSGKLADTFAKAYSDYPSSETFGKNGVEYTEDIFVGYRYFDTVPGAQDKVNYWFGYGLSYTTFAYSDAKLTNTDGKVTVSVKVTNTGKVAGKDVVAVYFGHPENTVLDYAEKELAGYQKTGLIEPGKSETVTVSYDVNDMSGYDMDGLIQKSAYVLEDGDYPIYFGNDVSTVTKVGAVNVASDTVAQQLSELCAATRLSKILQADGTYKTVGTSASSAYAVKATGTSDIPAIGYNKMDGALNVNASGFLERFNTNQNAELFYEINVEQAGKYALYASVACQANITGALSFYIDDSTSGVSLNTTKTSSASWYVFKYMKVGDVELTAGKHTVKIHVNGKPSINMKAMAFVPDGESLTYNTASAALDGQKSTILKATTGVDVDLAGSVNYSFNVNGYVERYNTNIGSTIWYVMDSSAAATYDVYINSALKTASANGPFEISVNGVKYDLSFVQPQTGEWTIFQNTKCTGTVTFPKGKCIVGITPKSGFKSNVSEFIFVPTGKTYETEIGKTGTATIKYSDVLKDKSLIDDFVAQFTVAEMAKFTHGSDYFGVGEMTNYGIPEYIMANGPAGIREGKQKSYMPCATLVGCTWNTILAYKFGVACGLDARDSGITVWLAPAVNIHRDPLCGRNFEYFSEDPLLSGVMGAAEVNGSQYCGVAVTVKHFCANNQEYNRNTSDSIISERALREIYLEPFRICVEESDPWAFMSSYNLLNGVETSERKDLITDILRGEWGFDGIVFTDWTNDSDQADELAAGNDVKMPLASADETGVISAYETGRLTRNQLEMICTRIVEFLIRIEEGSTKELDMENLGLDQSGYVPDSWSDEYLNNSIIPIKYVENANEIGFHTGMSHYTDRTETISKGGTTSAMSWDFDDTKEKYGSYVVEATAGTSTTFKNVSVTAAEGDKGYFWIYVEDASNVKELFWEIASSGTYNGACVRYLINSSYGQKLVNGWNKIEFELHDSTELSTDRNAAVSKSFSENYMYFLGGGMTGNVDWANINYIRVAVGLNNAGSYKLNALTLYEGEKDYKVTEGGNAVLTKGSIKDTAVRTDGNFDLFTEVKVDSKTVAADNYIVDVATGTVTLKASYLESLSVGKHDLEIVFENGIAATQFEVKAKPSQSETVSPDTGDDVNIYMIFVALVASAIAFAVAACSRPSSRKRR